MRFLKKNAIELDSGRSIDNITFAFNNKQNIEMLFIYCFTVGLVHESGDILHGK
jgi:hypothetical protein